jgi:hypothetical protein
MPPRSKIDQLPEEIRQGLEQRLIKGGFGNYRLLADWLAEQGFEISKTTVNQWGQGFQERVRALKMATDQAKAIVDASPDDEGAVSDALMRLVQEKLFQMLLDFQIDTSKPVNLGSIAKAVAELGRASVTQKKYAAEVRAKGSAVIDEMAKSTGMSEEQAAAWRAKFLGITEARA